MNSQSPKSEPDPDAIKMFVGQIPRSMDENDLRKMFEEFGPIYQLNVLRDKMTSQSKGCCFVTFYTRKSALEAQNALHNIKTLPGMQHPIQMKPADSEKRNEERKLFIGMLSKKCNENDVRIMFSGFGQIDECTVLRDQNGQSKGCAFVTFTAKQCAQNAIKAMHQSQTMEGCRAPLVVKFADTQKEKEMKKFQQANVNILGSPGLGTGVNSLSPQYLALLQQAAAAGNVGAMGNVNQQGLAANLQLQQLLTAAAAAAVSNPGDGQNMQGLQNLHGLAALASIANNPGEATLLSQSGMQNLASINQLAAAANSSAAGLPGIAASGSSSVSSNSDLSMLPSATVASTPSSSASLSGLQGSHLTANGLATPTSQSSMDAALTQAYTGIQQYAGLSGILNQASFPNAFAAQTAAQLQQAAANSPAGKVSEGPEGANLFIYHLPQEFSDQDLLQTFVPFGNVVSSKVFIDKQTNLSKCFGFVSYDNPVSAQAAIQAMNGFQIGMKRLKVQHKRPKSESKPY